MVVVTCMEFCSQKFSMKFLVSYADVPKLSSSCILDWHRLRLLLTFQYNDSKTPSFLKQIATRYPLKMKSIKITFYWAESLIYQEFIVSLEQINFFKIFCQKRPGMSFLWNLVWCNGTQYHDILTSSLLETKSNWKSFA